MSTTAGAATMALVGMVFSLQSPLNRGLGRATGQVPAAFVNFAVGLLFVLVACLLAGQLDGVTRIGPDWWHALGGCMAAAYVLVGVVVVGRIGASGVAAGALTGQLLCSIAVDSNGWLGVSQRPFEWRVALGGAAVLLGTYMVVGLGRAGPEANGSRPPVDNLVPLVAMALAGALLGIQIPLNGLLAESTGDFASGLINFLTGGAVLAVALLVTGSARGLAGVRRVRWIYLGGGFCGALNAVAALALVDRLGAGTIAAATVTGQMVASLAIDRAGLFGLEPRRLDPARLFGAGLLVVGTIVVAR
ncbi:MAG: DMT family transporter [Solirubrobacterales bacterium]